MELKLKKCTIGIRSGQTFRPLNQYQPGDLSVVLPKNIVNDRIENTTNIDPQQVSSLDKHLLRKGEIIIVNKGGNFNSFIYQGDPSPAIATTAFYIITPNEDILPKYLHWHLAQKETKDYLSARTVGSTVMVLTKKVLEELPIPLISLKEQYFLCSFIKEIQTEQFLLKEFLSKREEFAKNYVWEHIQKCL